MMDYMRANGLNRAFYGDGDSSVFVNVQSIDNLRPKCAAVINYERQSKFSWVGAGESSIWSLDALEDFCRYVTDQCAAELSHMPHIGLLPNCIANMRKPCGLSLLNLRHMWWTCLCYICGG